VAGELRKDQRAPRGELGQAEGADGWPLGQGVTLGVHLILKRKSPGSCGEGFEGDLVAEGLELGNGPTRFSSLVAAQAMGVLSEIDGWALCYPAFPQLALFHE
jgi:hypothetical protein